MHSKEWQKALDYYAQALALYRRIGDRHQQARTLTNLGFYHLYHLDQGDRPQAASYFDQALKLARESGDRGSEALSLRGLGWVQAAQGNEPQAAAHYQQALELSRALGSPQLEADVLLYMAHLARSRGRLAEAHTLIQEAVKVNETWLARLSPRSLSIPALNTGFGIYEFIPFYIDDGALEPIRAQA
jgi:tetratricopeptide (TPR) repeat protein